MAQDESGDLPEEEQQDVTTRFRKSQFGEVKFEEQERKDSYKVTQDQALAFFQDMDNKVKSLRLGSSVSPLSAPDQVLNFLTGAYLYCVMKSGICPLVLDALLEVDVINSKLQNSPQCPTLKKFWSMWIKNGMEDRSKYNISTGMLETVANFNTNTRPKYIHCEETVKKEIENTPALAAFFKERYKNEARPGIVSGKMVTFLSLLKEKIKNVFVATGSMPPSSLDSSAPARSESKSAEERRRK